MANHPSRSGPQRGSALIIALILLAVLMLFGITAIGTGLVNLKIARNTQLAAEAQMAAQRVIDTKISSLATFTSFASAAQIMDVDSTGDGATLYRVSFAQPVCVHIRPAPGYSYVLAPQAPKDTTWRIVASANDAAAANTGAAVTLTQGVKVRLPVNAVCD